MATFNTIPLWSFARECRFCGSGGNATVDLFETGLAAKASKFFHLRIHSTDILPKLICPTCETSLNQAYMFMRNAVLMQIELERKYSLAAEMEMTVEYLEDELPEKNESKSVDVAMEKQETTKDAVWEDNSATSEIVLGRVDGDGSALMSMENGSGDACKNNANIVPKILGERSADQYQRKLAKIFASIQPLVFVCQACSKKFDSLEELRMHVDTKIGCVICYRCSICGNIYDKARSFKEHQRKHLPKVRFTCGKCSSAFLNTFDLDNHRAEIHGDEVEELGYAYKCCNQSFQKRLDWRDHVATHKEAPALCSVCGKTFKNKSTLRSHLRAHSELRPHVCKVCGRSFKNHAWLIRHAQQHTGDDIFRCDQCLKVFAKKDTLKNHLLMFHSDRSIMCSRTVERLGLS